MVDDQLIEYIRKSQESGMSWDTIKKDLISAGWNQDQIEEANRVLSVPKPSIPVPTPPTQKETTIRKRYTSPYSGLLAVVLVISLLILAQNVVVDILNHFAPGEDAFYDSQEYKQYEKEYADRQADLSQQPRQEDYQDLKDFNRAYSEWQLRYNDSQYSLYNQYLEKYKQRMPSVSFRLILHFMVVMPFWILTFLLFLFLKENRRKYEALLGAYFVTSGWLLIFLLFNVALYIYNSSTAFGVYAVLGMLVVVLTAAIWGVQKYRHSIEQE